MAKTTGLACDFYFNGYHVGPDIQQLNIGGGPNLLDVTAITQSAHARLGGQLSGLMSVTAFNDTAAGQEHSAYSPLSRSDQISAFLVQQAVGNPVACMQSLQLNYDPTRAADGMLTEKVDTQSDNYPLEWGEQLTAGLRTDTTATNGTTQQDAAQTSNGGAAYLQAVSLTGSTVTVTLQHSTNGSSWSTLATFNAVTSAPAAQRIAFSGTVDQYVRANTSGTFTSFAFQVAFMRYQVAVNY